MDHSRLSNPAVVDGEVISISKSGSLARIAVFTLVTMFGLALAFLPLFLTVDWRQQIIIPLLGILDASCGGFLVFVFLQKWIQSERLIIGDDRIQLVHGQDTVVGQIPFGNISDLSCSKIGFVESVGVNLVDWDCAETLWPRGKDGYRVRKKKGMSDIMLWVYYSIGPRELLEKIDAKFRDFRKKSL